MFIPFIWIVFKSVGNNWTINKMQIMFFIPIWIHWTLYFTWLLFVGKTLCLIDNEFNLRQFKVKLTIGYVAFCFSFLPILFAYLTDTSTFDIPDIFSALLGLFFVYGFFSAIGWIIINLFKLEQKAKPKFGDYIETGFLIFFYPFGIWNIQKRIKKHINN
jgi:hypothetical protein